mmetsp:Transcript_28077/g.41748  ORF Transcript_28077/g.41748 Transcript_28077/m.41748 type:complete len:80 (-) Transcript_28077:35-274(-)
MKNGIIPGSWKIWSLYYDAVREIHQGQKEDERDAVETVRAGNALPPPRITLVSTQNILLPRYNDNVENGETAPGELPLP